MKVTFEQLKAAFNRVLISRGVDSETADAAPRQLPVRDRGGHANGALLWRFPY